MGRNEPLGVHTQAIIRLLELRKDYTTGHNHSFALWRSAYQRIHVRQLFAEQRLLSSLDSCDLISNDDD